MIKRYCDSCGKELCIEDPLKPLVWWTVTRHDSFITDITVELCNKCYNTDGVLVKEKERATDDEPSRRITKNV